MNKEWKRCRDRVAEIDVKLAEMADKLQTEKRSLTADEREVMNALKGEKEALQLRMNVLSTGGREAGHERACAERAFAEMVTAICRGEVPADYAEMVHRSAGPNYMIDIPHSRAVQDTAGAAAMVPVTIGDIVEPLEKGLILDLVGCKMQYGLTGDFVYPVVAGVEATIEDENAEVNDTTIDISSLKPTPRRVSLAIPVSNRAIDQTNTALLDVVIRQMTLGLTRLLNRWMFAPQRITSKASDGCFVKSAPTLAVGDSFTFKDTVALKGRVMATGAVFDGTAAYVCSASTYADLEATPRDAGSGRMVIENGRINGYPVFMTEYIGDGVLGFGIFNYELVGQFGQMRMTVDPYTGAKKNLVYFVLNTDFDLLTVRPEAFGIAKLSTKASIGVDATAVSLSTTQNVAVTKDIYVSGAALTANITAAVSGTNSDLFSVNKTSIAKDEQGNAGTKLTITYTPTATGSHSATLTLKSTGADDVTVALTGQATA